MYKLNVYVKCLTKYAFKLRKICQKNFYSVITIAKQECIPVGCVLPAAVAVRGGVSTRPLLWPSGVVAFCYGLLVWWPSVMAFWCGGLLLWPSAPPEDHTRRLPSIRRPPNQKGITEDHNRRPHPPPQEQALPLQTRYPPPPPPGADTTPPGTDPCWDQAPPWRPAARHAGIAPPPC